MLLGTMAIQNTILQWCSNHRMHHKKLDTVDDPYSIKEGFFHAHMGWILEQKEFAVEGVEVGFHWKPCHQTSLFKDSAKEPLENTEISFC